MFARVCKVGRLFAMRRERRARERFPQLLHDPPARGVLGNVEVEDTPSVVANDEKAVEHTEGDRGDCEEVHPSNRFSMIADKRPNIAATNPTAKSANLPQS